MPHGGGDPQKLADDNPAVTDFRDCLAKSKGMLGILLWQMGKPTEAEAECRTALAICQKLADDSPAVTYFCDGLANALNSLGGVVCRSAGWPRPRASTNGRSA